MSHVAPNVVSWFDIRYPARRAPMDQCAASRSAFGSVYADFSIGVILPKSATCKIDTGADQFLGGLNGVPRATHRAHGRRDEGVEKLLQPTHHALM